MDFVYVVLGLVILLLAGDSLVKGAVNVSLKLGIPALVISLTIVAIGTSAPEMLVVVDAVISGAPGIAVGNVVGSNIANVLLVLGFPALIFGLGTARIFPRLSYFHMAIATALFATLAFLGPFTWRNGLILLIIFFLFMGHSVRSARRSHQRTRGQKEQIVDLEAADPAMPWMKISVLIILGLVGLPLGASLLVGGATRIAVSFGISETVIGLTLVAVGTSLPELATTMAAALRRHPEVVLGSVIGSNIANLLGIIGVASFFGEIPIASGILQFDLWVMIGSSLLLAPFVFLRFDINRFWGMVFTASYIAYIVYVLTARSDF